MGTIWYKKQNTQIQIMWHKTENNRNIYIVRKYMCVKTPNPRRNDKWERCDTNHKTHKFIYQKNFSVLCSSSPYASECNKYFLEEEARIFPPVRPVLPALRNIFLFSLFVKCMFFTSKQSFEYFSTDWRSNFLTQFSSKISTIEKKTDFCLRFFHHPISYEIISTFHMTFFSYDFFILSPF